MSKKYDNKCCNCGTSKRLEVHHLTYERKGEELEEDLVLLCRDCHENEHEIKRKENLEKYRLSNPFWEDE